MLETDGKSRDIENLVNNEKEWIRKAQNGDQEAFGKIVYFYQARMRAFAARFIGSSNNVYDIVQDTFISAFKYINRFDNNKDFGKWIRGICRNRILNFFREEKTRKKRLSIITEIFEEQLISTNLRKWDNSLERIEALRSCINNLNEKNLKLIKKRYYYEMRIKDIAEDIGKNAATVSTQIMRIRDILKKCCKRRIKRRITV